MKKILFLITKSDVGGAQKWVSEQVHICTPNFDCFIATNKCGWLTRQHDIDKLFVDKGIEFRFSIVYLIKLLWWVKTKKIDIIIASSANAGIYARICNIFLKPRLRVIYVSHGWSALYNGGKLRKIYKVVENWLSFITDKVLCISECDFNLALNDIGIKREKLVLLRNNILPLSCLKKTKRYTKTRVLSVGRFVKPKRFDILIEAIKQLNFELHLVGDGPQLEGLKKNAPKNVFFHGEIEGFENFADYDLFCLISDSEGLPLSAIEAMCCGLPLVLSNVGGCSELIQDNGFLVENSPKEIARKLEIAIANKNLLSENSHKMFQKFFNLSLNYENYIEFYNET